MQPEPSAWTPRETQSQLFLFASGWLKTQHVCSDWSQCLASAFDRIIKISSANAYITTFKSHCDWMLCRWLFGLLVVFSSVQFSFSASSELLGKCLEKKRKFFAELPVRHCLSAIVHVRLDSQIFFIRLTVSTEAVSSWSREKQEERHKDLVKLAAMKSNRDHFKRWDLLNVSSLNQFYDSSSPGGVCPSLTSSDCQISASDVKNEAERYV